MIITDTITSDTHGRVIGKIATRSQFFDDNFSVDNTSLTRKTVVVSATAIAFAGSLKVIEDFLEYAHLAISDFDAERPLRELARRASQYSGGSLNVLAAMCLPGKNAMHKIKPDACTEHEIDGLGYCAAIGSGAEFLVERLKSFLTKFDSQDTPDTALAQIMAQHLCADALVREIYFGGQEGENGDRTWGGFFEYIFYDPIVQQWLKQPKTAYFVYQLDLGTGSGGISPQLIDRMFMYDAGTHSGWLHAIRSAPDHAYNRTYRLSSVYPKADFVDTILWSGWMPEQVSLCVVSGYTNGQSFDLTGTFFGGFTVDTNNGVTSGEGRTGVRLLPFGDYLESFLVQAVKRLKTEAAIRNRSHSSP